MQGHTYVFDIGAYGCSMVRMYKHSTDMGVLLFLTYTYVHTCGHSTFTFYPMYYIQNYGRTLCFQMTQRANMMVTYSIALIPELCGDLIQIGTVCVKGVHVVFMGFQMHAG